MKDKKLLQSLTVGQVEENYQKYSSELINNLLESVKVSALYTQMKYLSPILLYGVSPVIEGEKATIKAKASQHSKQLAQLIKNYSK